jgi:hypothetical protein
VPANAGTCKPNNAGRVASQSAATLTPGAYCSGGISVGALASVTLQPGTYYVFGADFSVAAGATVRCDCWTPGSGVTIVLAMGATATIRPGANVTLEAPADPAEPYHGIVFYQDRDSPRMTHRAELVGGPSMALTGALYFPATEVQFSGNNGATQPACIAIVARQVTFVGTSTIDASRCAEHGTATASVTGVQLLD